MKCKVCGSDSDNKEECGTRMDNGNTVFICLDCNEIFENKPKGDKE